MSLTSPNNAGGANGAAAAELVAWQPGPVSASPTFRCGACSQPRSTGGRKLRRVLGLRTWVCAACAPAARK